MKKILKTLSWSAGVLLSVVTAFAAVIYLFGVVIWMHAPVVPALLFTLAMALPFFVLSWILRRLGRSSSQRTRTQPWYPSQDKG
jgi:Kef-type K+ transport system membrane component KefB